MILMEKSITGIFLIFVIMLIRLFMPDKIPKRTFVILWFISIIHLLLPFSIPFRFSIYSVFNSNKNILSALSFLTQNDSVLSISDLKMLLYEKESIFPFFKNLPPWFIWVWIAGSLICALFFLHSYLRFIIKSRSSMVLSQKETEAILNFDTLRRKIKILISDKIDIPLTYGLFNPVIIIPEHYNLINDKDIRYIAYHEYVHIKNFDSAIKIIATISVAVHWFNPFVWILYILLSRDIELSCDESVIKYFGRKSKKEYANALIRMEEIKSSFIPVCNFFNKSLIEKRILSIMRIKKKSKIITVFSCLLVLSVSFLFAASEKKSFKTAGSKPRVYMINGNGEITSYDIKNLPGKIKERKIISVIKIDKNNNSE
ncbi:MULTISPECIES: M56 family metallopeptidase [unclassified Treponema]|uniref:M56 family metallopeptidase n=1 Tax=unclassified Treponema TaxID=2638727 RepID=UPI0020A29A3B|nr:MULTISPECIES: M56 family metallopeptidase [unclassified Treponema]UTC67387.1 M56 family metallopeptidase [Treponema sp. OMZ 789]UTC70115.1 M56 family metallopeptidase [Treponema sp. OMZ 790]UTC72830.1 M56 family metallopeptidase [Treponema sp. OMZ 791]